MSLSCVVVRELHMVRTLQLAQLQQQQVVQTLHLGHQMQENAAMTKGVLNMQIICQSCLSLEHVVT